MNNKDYLDLGSGCVVIAEVAQSHDGSLGQAHAFIDAVASTGAHAIKFQTHIAAAESTSAEPWRVKFSRQDASRYDYWRRMEFSEEAWHGLKRHAVERGLFFLSSPFSFEAVEMLQRVGVAAWKVASGEMNNLPLLRSLACHKVPVILSSGMSPFCELDRAVHLVSGFAPGLAVLQCTTEYPCPPERIGLNLLGEIRRRYQCKVGISDHSATIYPGLAAVSLGAEVVEVHVTLSRDMFGPDVGSSITVPELRQLVDGARFISTALANPVDKDAVATAQESSRRIFGKSLVAAQDLRAGTCLGGEHVALKKPGTGLGPEHFDTVLGRRLKRDLKRDEQITVSDYE